jgi:hypothetical protein
MSSTDLIADLSQRGVRLWLDGDHLRFRAPQGTLTSELKAQLAERHRRRRQSPARRAMSIRLFLIHRKDSGSRPSGSLRARLTTSPMLLSSRATLICRRLKRASTKLSGDTRSCAPHS